MRFVLVGRLVLAVTTFVLLADMKSRCEKVPSNSAGS